jgi:hypothetical protein
MVNLSSQYDTGQQNLFILFLSFPALFFAILRLDIKKNNVTDAHMIESYSICIARYTKQLKNKIKTIKVPNLDE